MSSRSERYLTNAEKCQSYADTASYSGTKRLYEELARQWLHLSEQADETDEKASSLDRESVVALWLKSGKPEAVERDAEQQWEHSLS